MNLLKCFPVVVTQVTDIFPATDFMVVTDELLRYRVKAEQRGPIDQQRVSVHFTLRKRDGAPRVGSDLLVTISDEDFDLTDNS